jgi:hypothetical protein
MSTTITFKRQCQRPIVLEKYDIFDCCKPLDADGEMAAGH